MVQAANTDLFNPSVPKAHNSECQNLQFPLLFKAGKSQIKAKCLEFYFLHPRH